MNLSDIDVLILCGGKGTRLAPIIGDDIPKCLAPINGRPFIECLVELLVAGGAKKITLVTGHLREKVEEWLAGYKHPAAEITSRHSWYLMGPLQDAADVSEQFEHGPMFVINGDTYPLGDFMRLLRNSDPARSVEYKLHGRSTGMYRFAKSDLGDATVEVQQAEILIPFSFIDIGTPEGYAKAQEILK